MNRSRRYTTEIDVETARLAAYLGDLIPPKALEDTLPTDVVDFFLGREIDGNSRTQFHGKVCLFWGQNLKPQPCGCRMGMPEGTFSTNLGKISKHFQTFLGRTQEWDPLTSTGNPCHAAVVRQHAKDLKRERDLAGVHTRKSAVLMSDKLSKVIEAITLRAQRAGLSSVSGFALIQDATYLSLLWSSSIRGGNLDKITGSQVAFLPGRAGLLISLYEHKTSATQKERKRMLAMRQANVWMDPVERMLVFQAVCRKVRAAGLLPEAPFVFRRIVKDTIQAGHFEIAKLNGRLETYLVEVGLFSPGERVHGIRAAEAVEAVLADGDLRRSLREGDWADTATAMGYLDLAATIAEIWEKDTQFRVLPEQERKDYFRKLEAGRLEAAFSL